MAFTIHIACNDHRNGAPQGFADAVQLESISLVGGRVTHADLSPAKSGERPRVRIGRIVVPYFSSVDWYGNWCWNAYSVAKVDALGVLNYLIARPDWHVEEAPAEIYDRIDSRRPLTPIEWRDMTVTER